MKLCLSARMFTSQTRRNAFDLDIESFVQFAKDTGHDGITLRPGQLDADTDSETVSHIAEILERAQMPCSFIKSMAIRDQETYEGQCQLLEHMNQIGCPILQPKVSSESDIPWTQKLCDEAAKQGAQISPQLHNGTLHDTVPRTLDLLKAVDRDNFGLNFEAAHLVLQNEPIRNGEAVRAIGNRIFSVCIQNYKLDENKKMIPCLPDDPKGVDFDDVFAALREISFDGFITHISGAYPNMDNRTLCENYLKYLRPLMA